MGIKRAQAPIWTFYDFVTPGGRNLISEWMESIPWEAKSKINVQLLTMMGMERWPETWASDYKGYEGVVELRISCNRVKYRPLGCYGPGRRQFTILEGAIEKGGKIPKGSLRSAEERGRILDEDCIVEHQFN